MLVTVARGDAPMMAIPESAAAPKGRRRAAFLSHGA
jgi:hypothetical protein